MLTFAGTYGEVYGVNRLAYARAWPSMGKDGESRELLQSLPERLDQAGALRPSVLWCMSCEMIVGVLVGHVLARSHDRKRFTSNSRKQ